VIEKIHGSSDPSEWIKEKLQSIIYPVKSAIDIASGAGRHSLLLSERCSSVTAVDRNPDLSSFFENTSVEFLCLDLEQEDWPLVGHTFDLVLVSNYLYRPNLRKIFDLVGPDGFLIYETFGVGNELFGKPSNPNFLLRPSELRDSVGDEFLIMEEFFGKIAEPQQSVKARLFGRREGS
jgi:SAM-dependent methyltransferase